MGFLKFLLIAILILWLLRIVMATLLPWILRRFARKMQEEAMKGFQQTHDAQFRQARQDRPKKAEGKIRIDYIPPQQPNQNGANSAGEFVDFEEVK
jgi:hypothetical protein